MRTQGQINHDGQVQSELARFWLWMTCEHPGYQDGDYDDEQLIGLLTQYFKLNPETPSAIQKDAYCDL